MQLEIVYNWILMLFSIGYIVANLENIFLYRYYAADSAFSTRISILEHFNVRRFAFTRKLYTTVYNAKVIVALNCLSIIVLLLCMVSSGQQRDMLIIIEFVIMYILLFRTYYAGDGSDQMNILIITVLFINAVGHDERIRIAGLVFLALQVVLSYMTAGIAKLISPIWRSGNSITGIFSTHTYSNSGFSALLAKYKFIPFLLSWTVMLWETLFVLGFLNEYLFYALLCVGVLFHLFIAVVMGLNNFFWSFIAAYPALLFTYELLHSVVLK